MQRHLTRLLQRINLEGTLTIVSSPTWKPKNRTVLLHIRMASLNTRKCQVVKETEIARGKWLKLSNYHWVDHTGRERQWEVAGRTTKGVQEHDCVAVVGTVSRKGHEDAMVLIKQFRPPLKAYTLEMPAGLIDKGETVEQAALREFREETGYNGEIANVGRAVALDPGMSSATMKIVTVKVDGDADMNKDVSKVCGVDGEHIEVVLVSLSSLQDFLTESAAHGMIIDSRVEAVALGLSLIH